MYKTNNSFCPIQAGGMQRKPIVENYGYPCDHEIIVDRVGGGTVNICVDSEESVSNFNINKKNYNIRYEGADTGGQLKCDPYSSLSLTCNYTRKKGELHKATSGDKKGIHIYRGNGGRYNIADDVTLFTNKLKGLSIS
uniref:Uncharacterized protein n=1 Tax=viral metagenome TaxID=1070528 RepID=A0A6C0D0M3_9ZZZZ